MAITEKITCDVCGVQKGQSNHWMLWTAEAGTSRRELGGIQFAPWNNDLYRDYNHLCGEACAGKLLAKSVADWRELSDLRRMHAVQSVEADEPINPAVRLIAS